MKTKVIALLLVLATVLSFAACGKKATTETTTPPVETTQPETQSPATYTGSLEDLVNAIYEKATVELKLGPAAPIDLTNTDAVKAYLGLENAEDIQEAVFSEPMMSSQAYSLCLVKAKEGADVEQLKADIITNVNPRKWICVEADNVRVASYGDVVILAMVESALSETLADDLINAFKDTVGGIDGEVLTKA